jgi:hypothetical protein
VNRPLSVVEGKGEHYMNQRFRCLWRLGPPLTISNREVKPTCADGTSLLRAGEYVDAGFLDLIPKE